MKTIAFLTGVCLMALLLPVLAFGNPFLVCDPQTDVTFYRVAIDGQEPIESPAQDLGDGTVRLYYDLDSIAVGSHIVQVAAHNEWGCSNYSDPFDFTKAIPETPLNLRVSSE